MREHELQRNPLSKGQVLMVATSCATMNDQGGTATGAWLSELAVPYIMFVSNGYDVTIASIKGGEVPLDPNSMSEKDSGPAVAEVQKFMQCGEPSNNSRAAPAGQHQLHCHPQHHQLQLQQQQARCQAPAAVHTQHGEDDVLRLAACVAVSVGPAETAQQSMKHSVAIDKVDTIGAYCALFLPGGHGASVDMPSCAALQRLLGQASEAGILIAALCHGNAALAGDVGKQLVRGKKVAVFSDEEERALGKEAVVPFLLETALRDAGAVMDCGPAGGERAVVDGKLITGQNPASSFKCASLVLEALSSNAPAGAPAASHPGSLTAAEAAAVLGVSPLPPGSSGPEAAAGGVVATSMGEDELGAALVRLAGGGVLGPGTEAAGCVAAWGLWGLAGGHCRAPHQAPHSLVTLLAPGWAQQAQEPPPPAQDHPPPAQAQPLPAAPGPAPPPQAPSGGRWLDRDTNGCLNFQRIGESMQRPLELCSWKDREALPPMGKEYQQGYKRVNDRLPKVRQRLHRAAEYRRGIDGRARNDAIREAKDAQGVLPMIVGVVMTGITSVVSTSQASSQASDAAAQAIASAVTTAVSNVCSGSGDASAEASSLAQAVATATARVFVSSSVTVSAAAGGQGCGQASGSATATARAIASALASAFAKASNNCQKAVASALANALASVDGSCSCTPAAATTPSPARGRNPTLSSGGFPATSKPFPTVTYPDAAAALPGAASAGFPGRFNFPAAGYPFGK
ncbi:hypothetical protein QJQ45_012852 [Haematococcus lacustris]|nr:hypothetical protein QJQ45_012852 [Haematococcus lacustris]